MSNLLSEVAKKELEEQLLNYGNINREIALRKLEIQTQSEHDENIGGGRSSLISKQAESLIIKYESDHRIQYLINQRNCIEKTYAELGDEMQKIFEMRWISGEWLSWEYLAEYFHLGRTSIYRKRTAILEKYAKNLGKL